MPPPNIDYPEFLRDGKDFYRKIGRPDLKNKYDLLAASQKLGVTSKAPGVNEINKRETKKLLNTEAATVSDLNQQMQLHKKKTRIRIEEEIISKMEWKMWETDVSAIGQYLEDPKFIQSKAAALNAKSHFKNIYAEAH